MPALPEQVDTKGAAEAGATPIGFKPISLLDEKKRGGWNNYTEPVGMAKPGPLADVPGTRGAADYYEAHETEAE